MTDEREERLRELRRRASPLESGQATRSDRLAAVARHGEAFLEAMPSQPVYKPRGDRSEALEAMQITDTPAELDHILHLLDRYVDNVGYHLGSPRFFAYIPSGGLYESALADYHAAVINPYSGVGFSAPGAARMEEALLRWLSDLVGYPPSAGGDLASGGSMAATSAIIAARETAAIRSRNVARHVVYLTVSTHHTFRKALHVAGLGDAVVRQIPLDERQRMRPDALLKQVRADKLAGLTPWLVAASAGATDTGAIDPLPRIADIARDEGLWFHVDAAYGGAFALCREGRRRLEGLEQSDSLILDPHKGFFLPCGIGVVLVRDGAKLYSAFHARGTYMQDVSEDTERSPCDLSPELTRPFRALRFWLPFKLFGTAPFAAALEEKLLLAEYCHEQLARMPGIEVGPPPDLSVVTFRYLPETGDADDFNRRLVTAIRDDGRAFLSSTTIDGKFTIRLAILGHNSHREHVDTALEVVAEKTEELSAVQAR